MKLFQITNIKILDPITVVSGSNQDAANYFVEALHRALGHVPLVDYAVTQWSPQNLSQSPALQTILDRPYRGFAREGQHGWEFIDPLAQRP